MPRIHLLMNSRGALAPLFLWLLVSSGCASAPSAPDEPDAKPQPIQRLLMVGNSFTYYNDSLHNHVGNLLRASGRYERGVTRLRALTLSGASLAEHAPAIGSYLDGGDFDAVLMQGYSTAPLQAESLQKLHEAAARIATVARAKRVEPILWMTWPYQGRPEMTEGLLAGYESVADSIGARLVPVGLAFEAVNREHPEIDLYSPDFRGIGPDGTIRYAKDVKHPSRAGSYLAACVIVAALFDLSPVDSQYTAGLDADTARRLQKVANETVASYRSRLENW